jgi:phosphate starvation-inducible membrane PsiE
MPSGKRSASMKIELGFRKLIHHVENAFLLVIALLTMIGVGKEIYLIAAKVDIGLQDLLLMFLYVEVLAMVGAYYESKQVPITLPIFMALFNLCVGFRPQFGGILGIRSGRRVPDGTSQISTAAG